MTKTHTPPPTLDKAIAFERKRCIDLITLVLRMPETYSTKMGAAEIIMAGVWLIEHGYTPENAPTMDEREELEAAHPKAG